MLEPPPRIETGHDWLGAHLFFDGDIYSDVCDRVLLEVVTPLVKQLAGTYRRWFFIRYHEGSPHIRLRFFARPGRIAEEVRPAIEEASAANGLVRQCAFVDYEPEVERYGGPHGVVLAEELFHHSSAAALALLRKADSGGRSAKFGKAVLAMLVQLHAFFAQRETAAKVARAYGKNYLRSQVPDPRQQELWLEVFEQGFDRQADHLADYVEAAWEALTSGAGLPEDLAFYRRRMRETAAALHHLFDGEHLFLNGQIARRWYEARRWVLPSYLHMMNNRLGVSIREECYLCVPIYRSLQHESQ